MPSVFARDFRMPFRHLNHHIQRLFGMQKRFLPMFGLVVFANDIKSQFGSAQRGHFQVGNDEGDVMDGWTALSEEFGYKIVFFQTGFDELWK